MVGWHDGTYLNLVSKVRNGFIPHLYSAIIRATEKASLRQMSIQQFTRKASRLWALNLTNGEMQNCQVDQPLLIAQIQFTERTLDRHL